MDIGALPGALAGWHLSKIRQPIVRWVSYLIGSFVLYGIVLVLGILIQTEIFASDQISDNLNWGRNAGIGCVVALIIAARKKSSSRRLNKI
ncbi:MAG: hypothetical protein OXC68_14615 [Aestuariivita sp.]|nr:hypothetical protein [Aestuariivita sp.]